MPVADPALAYSKASSPRIRQRCRIITRGTRGSNTRHFRLIANELDAITTVPEYQINSRRRPSSYDRQTVNVITVRDGVFAPPNGQLQLDEAFSD